MKPLSAVSTMHVDDKIRSCNELRRNDVSDALGLRATRITGKRAIQVLSVIGVNVRRSRFERTHVAGPSDQHYARQLLWINRLSKPLSCKDGGELIAMNTCCDKERRAWF